ncbi:MAG: hypothetical protein C0462_12395 [Alcanivorax sp.]|nr:hypothetical protein [Alcanivorax sp.]
MAHIEVPNEAKLAQTAVECILGDSIVAIYLFGSVVVGGLKRYSDADILITVSSSPILEQRKAMASQLMSISGAIGNPQAISPLDATVMVASDVIYPRVLSCKALKIHD